MPNHLDVVQQVAAVHPPAKTLDGALQFVLAVLAELNARFPEERAGLLEKVAPGEGIVPYAGTTVAAGRICYPNQHTVKLLTDVPTTNGPEWVEEGLASIGGFLRGYLPPAEPTAPPTPTPVVTVPQAPPVDSTPAVDTVGPALADLRAHLDAEFERVHAHLDAIVKDAEKTGKTFLPLIGRLFGK